MSIEQALAENTAAIKALTAAIAGLNLSSLPQSLAPTSQPVPAPSALSTADASLEQTAPVVLTVSLPDPTSVFGQAALPSAPLATPAAPPTASPAAPANGPAAPANGPAAQGNVASVAVDKNGLPWDGRIHASSKAVVADGSWRMKRGVDPDLVTKVTAELRQIMTAPAGPAVWGNQPWPFATSGADVAPASTFAGLMAILPGKMVSGELTTDQIAAACASVGVPNLPALAAREDLVPAVAAVLELV